MRIGIDGRKIPEAAKRGPIGSLDHGKSLGMAGLFYRTVLDMSPTLDLGELRAIRSRADELGMYVETGLGKVNPYASPEAPELRLMGDGDIVLGFRRMMEACVAIGCTELWIATANYKPVYSARFAYDRFRTDVTWPEQLEATKSFLLKLAPIARDLGVHMNMETHEEITTFELLRLIEAVGEDVMGVVLDTLNPMQRAEHPVFAARRVAPYVRQTHIKDAYLAHVAGGVTIKARACGDGVVDFREVLKVLAAHTPTLNLSLECAGPREANFEPRARNCRRRCACSCARFGGCRWSSTGRPPSGSATPAMSGSHSGCATGFGSCASARSSRPRSSPPRTSSARPPAGHGSRRASCAERWPRGLCRSPPTSRSTRRCSRTDAGVCCVRRAMRSRSPASSSA